MKVAEYIAKVIEDQGRTKTWVAGQCDINYKTFVDKLKNDRFTADDLLRVGKVLNIDLNKMKEKLYKMERTDILEKVKDFTTIRHPELFQGDMYHKLGEETIDWANGNRIWVYSQSRKYLFYFEDGEIVGVFDRTTGENNKIF